MSPDHKIMPVPVVVDSSFHAGKPASLFAIHPTPWENVFDISGDAQRFLVNSLPEDAGSPPLTMLFNWPGLLTKSGPAR